MLDTNFGIEIELTGITRSHAADVIAEVTGGTKRYVGTYYDAYEVTLPAGRAWKVMSDGSIYTQKRENGRLVPANKYYSCEVISPILTYRGDMEMLQSIVRALRHHGAIANNSTGIHIHLDGRGHDARTIRNWINLVASKNDLLYKALNIEPSRRRWCKEMDAELVRKINERKPRTLDEIEDIWYEGYEGSRTAHYNSSRYHLCNLHSFFNGHHTVELRAFNSTTHAGVIRSYVALALAMNQHALTAKTISPKKPITDNERFTFRTFLVRIGLNGAEFANCREHLTKYLDGNSAWRYGRP